MRDRARETDWVCPGEAEALEDYGAEVRCCEGVGIGGVGLQDFAEVIVSISLVLAC